MRKKLLLLPLTLVCMAATFFVIHLPNNTALALAFQENVVVVEAKLENPSKLSSKDAGKSGKEITFIVTPTSKNILLGARLKGIISKISPANNNSRAIIKISLSSIELNNKHFPFKGWITRIDGKETKDLLFNCSGEEIPEKPKLLLKSSKIIEPPEFLFLYSNKNFDLTNEMEFEFEILDSLYKSIQGKK